MLPTICSMCPQKIIMRAKVPLKCNFANKSALFPQAAPCPFQSLAVHCKFTLIFIKYCTNIRYVWFEYKLNNSYTTLDPELTWFVMSYSYEVALLNSSDQSPTYDGDNPIAIQHQSRHQLHYLREIYVSHLVSFLYSIEQRSSELATLNRFELNGR